MGPSDYALLLSISSIFISIGALLWNVWQKFIFVRPTLQVSFGRYRVVQLGMSSNPDQRLLMLTVTNMGPGPVVLSACIGGKQKRWWGRVKPCGSLNPIHGDPIDPNPRSIGPSLSSDGSPVKIDAGDVKSFYFPYTKDCFLKEGLARIGINDTYHRMIWCHRSDMRKVYRSYQQDFIDMATA